MTYLLNIQEVEIKTEVVPGPSVGEDVIIVSDGDLASHHEVVTTTADVMPSPPVTVPIAPTMTSPVKTEVTSPVTTSEYGCVVLYHIDLYCCHSSRFVK